MDVNLQKNFHRLTYKEFQINILDELNSRKIKDVELQLQTNLKCNDHQKVGILFKKSNHTVSPQIYLEEYFSLFQSGVTIKEIGDMILHTYQELPLPDMIDTDRFHHLETVKDHICMKLINTERNPEFLKTVPHTPFEDLSIVYYYLLSIDDNGVQTITINNEMMELLETDTETLHQFALENTVRLLSVNFSPIEQVLQNLSAGYEGKPENTDGDALSEAFPHTPFSTYVLTNKIASHGAVLICCNGLMEQISRKLGGNFYIIPSSIHETILLPQMDTLSEEEINLTIQDVNQNKVSPEEFLSSHLYYYDTSKKQVIGIADRNESTD